MLPYLVIPGQISKLVAALNSSFKVYTPHALYFSELLNAAGIPCSVLHLLIAIPCIVLFVCSFCAEDFALAL